MRQVIKSHFSIIIIITASWVLGRNWLENELLVSECKGFFYCKGIHVLLTMGPLQLSDHVVQNCHTGEQMMH